MKSHHRATFEFALKWLVSTGSGKHSFQTMISLRFVLPDIVGVRFYQCLSGIIIGENVSLPWYQPD